MGGRRKEKIPAIPGDARRASFNRHNILSTGLVASDQRSRSTSLSLAISSAHLYTEKEKGSERTLVRSIESIETLGQRFSTIDPIPASTGGRSDAPAGSQGGANALSSPPPPPPLSKHSTRPTSDQRTYLPPLPPVRFVPLPPPSAFHWLPEKRPQVILKNGSSTSAVARAEEFLLPRARARASERCVGCSEGSEGQSVRFEWIHSVKAWKKSAPVIISVNGVNGRNASDNFERGRLTRAKLRAGC